ncbi:MAG: response regulator containing a CheY-like receiver domain and an DNA-binding domain [Bacteroidota bacterium]|jgi:CheY-like chemotaxis protein|nr:response regulator containing a CheY-like receiver domain and an DNA-binding domain [Bacteroidota bacterium]
MNIQTHFVIIDDDEINNIICKTVIEFLVPNANIKSFCIAKEGFAYVANQRYENDKTTVLFLDINMPSWSGWDFLDQFEKLENLKKEYQIFMLSSSLDPNDKRRALENKNVTGFIEKPLTLAKLQQIFLV